MPLKKFFTIDTSIAQSAGRENATSSMSINCHCFLDVIYQNKYFYVVFSQELLNEWQKPREKNSNHIHASSYSLKWLSWMYSRKKVFRITDNIENIELREKILSVFSDKQTKEKSAIKKDFLLIETALAKGKIIVSLDETVRELFCRAAHNVREICDIIWVNPDKIEDLTFEWLENNSPIEKNRQIKNQKN